MDKHALSERDICTKFITPALRQAGWNEISQIREEVSFTKGRIIVRGKLVSRGKGKRADYILSVKPNIPLALIEAKDNTQPVGGGLQQGLEYAESLGTRTLAQPTLNVGLIEVLPIPLPPLAEQHRIVARVDALMALCDQLEAGLAGAEATRTRSSTPCCTRRWNLQQTSPRPQNEH